MKLVYRLCCIFFLLFGATQHLEAAPQKKTTQVQKKRKKTAHKKKSYKPPVRLKKKPAPAKQAHKRAPQRKQPVQRKITPTAAKKTSPTKPLIVLDAGHGGFDLGASSHSVIEKILCLSTAQLLKKQLNTLGYRVVLTRTRDVFLSLKQRTAIANKVRGKLFLSIHYNAAKSVSASGIEVYYYESGDAHRARESKKLATTVLSRMLQQTGALSRGVKRGNFHVIRETTMPAILIEGGFITNRAERTLISDLKYREKLAKSIADGVDRYCKAARL